MIYMNLANTVLGQLPHSSPFRVYKLPGIYKTERIYAIQLATMSIQYSVSHFK